MFMHSVCLPVCPSVCALSNTRKYSSDVFKFMYAIYVWCRVEGIKNVMHRAKDLFTEAHKSFPIHYGIWEGGKFLKSIITYFCCTKYNKNNTCYSNV